MPALITRGAFSAQALIGRRRTTWNPLDKSSGVTLSNGNLTALGAGVLYRAVRGTIARASSGKFYFEWARNSAAQTYTGIGTASATLEDAVGTDASGYGYYSAGELLNAGANVAAPSAYGSSDTARMAVDFDHLKLWCGIVGGDWNGSGSADPATNTGGISFTAGIYMPMASMLPGCAVTANFGGRAFVGTRPTGFRAWNG